MDLPENTENVLLTFCAVLPLPLPDPALLFLVTDWSSSGISEFLLRLATRKGEKTFSTDSRTLCFRDSYIPIQSDYSDLVDVAAYFIGAPDGSGSHDKVAKRIAQQGKKWSDEHWREVDMKAYLFRLCEATLFLPSAYLYAWRRYADAPLDSHSIRVRAAVEPRRKRRALDGFFVKS